MKRKQFKLVHKHVGFGRFIMVAIPIVPKTKEKRARAVLHMEKLKTFGDFDKKMKLIRSDIKTNAATFATPPVSVADGGTFDNDIKAYESAETVALTKITGSSTARDITYEAVITDAHQLQGYVQTLADALHNTQKAVALIQLSGFDVSLHEAHSKSDFAAKKTKISGQLKLAINVKKFTNNEKRYSVKWQSATDTTKTPVDLPATIKGSTLVSGLTVGTFMWFRFLVVLKDGEHGWSAWLQALVQ
jgi:hypothetical protein